MVSIIIPVYKVEKYLHACVDSILEQTYRDLQVILVDDGSPDRCGAICDDYAAMDSRVLALHKENGGVSSARNLGLQYVQGEYVTFCDSDDMYKPDWISNLVSAIETSGADVALGNFCRVTEDEETLDCSRHETGLTDLTCPEETVRYCFEKLLTGKHAWEVCVRLFKMEIIHRYNICFCESCDNFAEDMGFSLGYTVFANRVISVETAGYLYRTRTGSMMHSSVDCAKLNAVNEVFLHFEPICRSAFEEDFAERILPLFHFLIMREQYMVVLKYGEYHKMADAVVQIRRLSDWEVWVKKTMKSAKTLTEWFGTYNAQRIRLLLHFCLHRNGLRYKIERRLFYMLKNKMEDCYGGKE